MSAIPKEAPEAADFVTTLRCLAPLNMTKVWQADGTIKAYDDAKHFYVKEIGLSGIEGLYRLIKKVADDPRVCFIRGKFIGALRAQEIDPPEKPDQYRKINALFGEVPHHWALQDVDGFRPEGIDPCADPVGAIEQYIARCLPDCFQGVSYVWQLSASAGAPGKEGILKAHIWFWFKKAWTGPQLTAWARATGAELDVSVLRRVQANFTATPVFEDGASDPVPVRIGFERGWAGDEVALEIDEAILASVERAGADESGGDGYDLIDPKGKPGLIGMFCRTFSMEQVLERWLPEVFEFQDGSERRLNYLLSESGAKGSAFISDCREYVINMSNSDPMQSRATNKWDLVRHYVFGDADEGADPLELAVVSSRPSHLAMMEMVGGLEEVKAGLREAKMEAAGAWREKVEGAADEFELREVANEIKKEPGLDAVAREQLAGLVQGRFRGLGIRLPISTVRGLVGVGRRGVGPAGGSGMAGAAPGWCRSWVYVTDGDCFFELTDKRKVTERGFCALFNRNMKPWADPTTGIVPTASSYALNEWALPVVSRLWYMPGGGDVFEMLGATWANVYKEDSAPARGDYNTVGGRGYEAVERLKLHLRKFFPNRRERRLFASWLAHNVQFPGRKIRWAPYIHGYEGDGKSFFLSLLAAVMGPVNVRSVSGSTLESSFTDWAIGFCVIAIEEMKQHGHNRYEVMNRLKPYISNSEVEIHPKGKASFTAPNTANYIIFSNYLDGAPVDEWSRRYMFLTTGIAQEDLPGMVGYFKDLFDMLEDEDCVAGLRGWLLDFDLDEEFEANGRAPHTEIRRTVVEMSRNEAETIARDAVEHGVEGICGTAVSSAHLSNYTKDKLGEEADVRTSRIAAILAKLGFRFFDRRKWQGDMRRIWIKGPDRSWPEVKAELDQTLGKTGDFGDESDE